MHRFIAKVVAQVDNRLVCRISSMESKVLFENQFLVTATIKSNEGSFMSHFAIDYDYKMI